VDEKSAADLSGPRRRCCSIESATLSRCSARHAANPRLTNKAGEQEAKEDDDEREVERHFGRLTLGRVGCQGEARDPGDVDECATVHNNTFMKRAALPVILLNTVRSTGATG